MTTSGHQARWGRHEGVEDEHQQGARSRREARHRLTAARARENEERFAAANAEIAATAEALDVDELVPFLCECSNTRCTKVIQLSLVTYAGLKSHESTFILLSRHEDANVEQVVGQTDGYLLVESTGPKPAHAQWAAALRTVECP